MASLCLVPGGFCRRASGEVQRAGLSVDRRPIAAGDRASRPGEDGGSPALWAQIRPGPDSSQFHSIPFILMS